MAAYYSVLRTPLAQNQYRSPTAPLLPASSIETGFSGITSEIEQSTSVELELLTKAPSFPKNGASPKTTTTPRGTQETTNSKTKRCFTGVTELWDSYWGLEFGAWLVSALFLLAIIITFLMCDGRGLPSLPSSISINALISVFAQVSQTFLIFPTAECIGQLKWLWFTNRARKLTDFEAFEDARRGGPWASLLLIVRTRVRHLVCLGALLTIVSLAFQPFAQQALSTPNRLISNPSEHASLQTLKNWTIYDLQAVPGTYSMETIGFILTETWSAIYNGLNSSFHNFSDAVPTCSTGNCTWETTYDSIAVTAEPVVNLTAFLNITALSNGTNCDQWPPSTSSLCEYSLPNGAIMTDQTSPNVYMNISSSSFSDVHVQPVPYSMAYRNLPTIVNIFVIYYSNAASKVLALEGALTLCAQTYNTSVSKGSTSTQAVKTWGQLNTTSIPASPDSAVRTYPITDSDFFVDQISLEALQTAMQQVFSGDWRSSLGAHGNNDYQTPNNGGVPVAAQSLSNILWSAEDEMLAMTNFMNGMAISLSNSLRTGTGSTAVPGTALSIQTYVHVEWAWLALPISLVLLTLVFLVATIAQSRRRKLQGWKSSSLAVLTGLDSKLRDDLGALGNLAALEKKAENTKVIIERERDGWRLVSAST